MVHIAVFFFYMKVYLIIVSRILCSIKNLIVSRSGLLVGLEETEGSILCLYDLGLSRVVKAVVIPGRVSLSY